MAFRGFGETRTKSRGGLAFRLLFISTILYDSKSYFSSSSTQYLINQNTIRYMLIQDKRDLFEFTFINLIINMNSRKSDI